MAAETLSIRLPPEMALLVRNEVALGAYASDSDVIEAALQLLQERAERLRDIKTVGKRWPISKISSMAETTRQFLAPADNDFPLRARMPVEHLELCAIRLAAIAEDAVADLGIDRRLGLRDAVVGTGFDARRERPMAGVRRGGVLPRRAQRSGGQQRRDEQRRRGRPQAVAPPCLATSAMRDWYSAPKSIGSM